MNRRTFLRILGLAGLGFFGYAVFKNLGSFSKPPRKKIYLSRDELTRFLVFKEEVILIKKDKEILVFSRKCPHLGCLLSFDAEKEEFVCPCHKSRFTLEGKYLDGPAKKDLIKLNFQEKENEIEIELV